MKHIYAIVFLLSFAIITAAQDCNKNNARAYVNELFKKGKYISYDSTEFRGYIKDFTIVKTPTLNKLLPGYCFFSTSFYSYNFEYSKVETAIALSKASKTKSKIAHSPLYTNTPDDFIDLFIGIKTTDTTERISLAKDITTIFASITYKGHLNRLLNLREKDVISFELWSDDLSWRFYNFFFDKYGKLTEIKIENGVGRSEMNSDYLRIYSFSQPTQQKTITITGRFDKNLESKDGYHFKGYIVDIDSAMAQKLNGHIIKITGKESIVVVPMNDTDTIERQERKGVTKYIIAPKIEIIN